jgi:hypothetical protein
MDPLLEPRPEEELFDVSDDAHQLSNIVGNSEHRKILDDLRKLMDQWQRRTGDTTPPLDKATPDRFDRRTGKPIHGKGGRPAGGRCARPDKRRVTHQRSRSAMNACPGVKPLIDKTANR